MALHGELPAPLLLIYLTTRSVVPVLNSEMCGQANVFSVYVCNVAYDSLTVCTKLGIVCVSINAVRV